MVTTYVLTHEGPNGHYEVCEEQIRYLQSLKRPFEILNWPGKEGAGRYEIPEVKKSFDFSKLKFPAIFLNGHGILHGRTFFFVDAIRRDLDYFQIDQHGDLAFEIQDEVDCATHAFKISRLRHVKKMKMLGLNPFNLTDELGYFDGDNESDDFNYSPSPALSDPKVELFIAESWEKSCEKAIQTREYIGEEMYRYIERIEKYGRQYLTCIDFNPASTKTPNAYVSIDLDVLGDFPSGWRGGLWSLDRVVKSIERIGKAKKIIGADICGLDLSSPPERRLSEKRKQQALKDILTVHDTLTRVMAK